MITLTFADGTSIENLTMNGSCFVSETEVDESIFTSDALESMTITDDEAGTEETWENVVFDKQIHYDHFHGNTGYYLIFHCKSAQEVEMETTQLAITELYETLLEMMREE